MTKLRIALAGLLIAAVLAVGLPLSASGFYPPALYRVTVIVDDAYGGPGLTVRAYVGTETVPRAGAEAITNSGSVAIVQIPIMSGADLTPTRKAVRFTVEDHDLRIHPEQVTVANVDGFQLRKPERCRNNPLPEFLNNWLDDVYSKGFSRSDSDCFDALHSLFHGRMIKFPRDAQRAR